MNEHAGIIHKVCRLYANSETDREDLHQEILIQLWKSFPKFRAESKISTWMYRISLNTAISNLRIQQRSPRIVETEWVPSPVFDPNESNKEANLKSMYDAISTLSEIEKAVVILYLEEKSYEEMEEILGMSQGNLRVKMNRIKEKLRKIMVHSQSGSSMK
ncbi:MAG: RNA polymerase subunit sigma-70 [Bacteroidetes bacterium]|nr:MAG: RNA polymerase subunit sigma-70 [Bacteroidota bacterium]